MGRYLLQISYLGTRYRGSQKHTRDSILDIDSIQGAVEYALNTLRPKPISPPNLILAGRTDAGVHALCTGAHIDLENKWKTDYIPDLVLKQLNRTLVSCFHEIRILSFTPVPEDFHARKNAITRTYAYRFLLSKDGKDERVPVAEMYKSFMVHSENFDIEGVKNAAKLFKGTKDFQSFCNADAQVGRSGYIRTMNDIKIEKTLPLMPLDPLSNKFDYWQITFKAKSFLYNQIRRIAAALISVGKGKVTLENIQTMLQVPSHQLWHMYIRGVSVAAPYGLYLVNVEYDEDIQRRISECNSQMKLYRAQRVAS